jgi:glycerol-3-phosphate dehydrogenase (NAD(P)+)
VTFDSVGIIGGGAWGTALAQTARLAGRQVLLWALEADVVAEINASHANTPFLPGVPLDPGLRATACWPTSPHATWC